MNDKKSNLKWESGELPKIYKKFESILYQTSWILKQELKRQKKSAEKIKVIFEQEMNNQIKDYVNKKR